MSDQGYGESDGNSEDDVLPCLKSCSPIVRKIGYYLTFLAGVVVFLVGIIDLLGSSVIPLIIGSIIVILSPLWIKSPIALCKELKNPVRLTSTILFVVFLVLTILANFVFDSFILRIIFGICLGFAGIWYFLSFFENGQKAFIACLKSCCGKEQQGETPPPS